MWFNLLRYVCYTIVGIAVLLLSLLFNFGVSCILTTVLFYVLLFLIGSAAIRFLLKKNTPLQKNLLLSLSVFLGLLLCIEFVLRYGVKADLNYCEQNNEFFSFSQRVSKLDYLVRKYIDQEPKQWFHVDKNISRTQGNQEFSYQHNFNSIGFRDSEPGVDTSRTIIISLGDSFTEGVGTPQDSTYPILLQGVLNREHPAIRCRVLNAGHAGNDVFGEYMILKNICMQYNPKLVILLFNSSDISEVIDKGGMERFKPDGTQGFPARPWWVPITEVSYIFRFYVHRVLHYTWNFIKEQESENHKTEAQQKIVDCIANYILPLTAKNNCRLILVYQPVQGDLENQDELAPIKKMMTAHPEVSAIDLYPVMKQDMATGKINLDSIYWPIDRHFNSKGYSYLAQTLYAQLKPLWDSLPTNSNSAVIGSQ